MRRINRPVALNALLVLALTGVPVSNTQAKLPTSFVPECLSVDFSPEYATDHKGFCVAFDESDGEGSYRFFRTVDGGRTWERRAGTGWTVTPDDNIGSVIVSPGYGNDQTVFVQTGNGVFSTTDDGETFALVDNFASTGPLGPNLTAYIEDAAGAPGTKEGERPVLAHAAGDASMKIDPPYRIPVPGAPFDERRFLFPTRPDDPWAGYTMTVEIDNTQSTARSRNVLFRCDEQLVCAEQLSAFPWGYQFDANGGIWFPSDFPESERVYFTTSKFLGGFSSLVAWKSDDGGATFRRWESVNRFLRPLRHLDSSHPTVGLGLHPARPRTIYMRLGYRLSFEEDAEGHPPIERFFVSKDRGRTWERISFGRDDDQAGRNGTIPWDGNWGGPVDNYVGVMADGTIFVMAREPGGHSGLYCSTDGGRSWAPLCSSS